MNIFKGVLAVAAAVALTFTGATVASAGPAHAATVTITFDADGTPLPVAAAAADWSKSTDISVVTGDCTGPNCVHFKIITNAVPCNYHVFINGCAYSLSDGSCQVEVYSGVLGRPYFEALVTKHEAGHCIFKFGGKAVSFHLPDSPHALMSANQPGDPGKKDSTLTSIDREFTRSLF